MDYTLVINTGSTSTKIAIYNGSTPIYKETIQHNQAEIEKYEHIINQMTFRKEAIIDSLINHDIKQKDLIIVIGIGGLIKPDDAGVYVVNQDMISDLQEAKYDEHAANLAAVIGYQIAKENNIKAYIADAITADEMDEVGRLSGITDITRLGRSHTLNQKYTAKKAAKELGIKYEEAHFVIVHLGGGISITAHRNGKMVDTNAARGEGPFCIDRSGGVNSFELAKLCFSGKYTKSEVLKKINGNGGIVAYLGTRDFREVETRVNNEDEFAKRVFQAMVYQISKEIAAQTVALEGRTDAIVLTGGMANSNMLCDAIRKRISYLGKVLCYPGEGEMDALAEYAKEILNGEKIVKEYRSKNV